MATRIGILLFDDVDLLDVGGPYEVFLTAGRLSERMGRANPFEVLTVGVTIEMVRSYGGLGLTPTHASHEAGSLDVVIVPGAIAIDEVCSRTEVRRAVESLMTGATVAASVCTGAFVLGEMGLLDGIAWTTHWEDVDRLSERLGSPLGVPAPWVDAGNVVTGGGLSNGIAMALHLVERLAGRGLALQTAQQLDFRWDPDAGITA